MDIYSFFKPTPLYKEFVILDLIENEKRITQRILSNHLGVSVSMINVYLDECEKSDYIKRVYTNPKIVKYIVTKKGIERRKVLNIRYLETSYHMNQRARKNIDSFITTIINKGYKTIMLYGGGEVAEILLQTISLNKFIPLKIIAVIDDDIGKQKKELQDTIIIDKSEIFRYKHDGILISSYIHREVIFDNLVQLKYNQNNIIHFFDWEER